MILIGLGSNLPSFAGSPAQTIEAARRRLDEAPLRLMAMSRTWRTRPIPDDGTQPWYANAVARIDTGLQAGALLSRLHEIEHEFGRERYTVNAARTLDLDLLDYDGQVSMQPHLPHPRLGERAFVLKPLAEIAPQWRHPVTGSTIEAMLASLGDTQDAEPEIAP